MTELTKVHCQWAVDALRANHPSFLEDGPQGVVRWMIWALTSQDTSSLCPKSDVQIMINELNNGEADQFLAGLLGYY